MDESHNNIQRKNPDVKDYRPCDFIHTKYHGRGNQPGLLEGRKGMASLMESMESGPRWTPCCGHVYSLILLPAFCMCSMCYNSSELYITAIYSLLYVYFHKSLKVWLIVLHLQKLKASQLLSPIRK